MGKINGCLRCLFIFFNVLLAIIGCLLIYGAIKSSAYSLLQLSEVRSSVRIWVFAIGVLSISCLGIYAGVTEKEIVLKIFAGFMAAGMIIMLIFGIIVVVKRNKFKSSFDSAAAELAKSLKEDEKLRKKLDGRQRGDQCCGVVSASDWGDNIPNSCECSSGSGCTSKPQGVSGPDLIYAQPCYEITWIDFVFSIVMGVYFGFAAIALLGLLLSLLMIRNFRCHNSSGGTSIAMRGY